MKPQTVLFIILVVIVGIVFYQSQNKEDAVNPLKGDRPAVEESDDAMMEDSGAMMVEDSTTGDAMDDMKVEDDSDSMQQDDTTTDAPVMSDIEGQTFTEYDNKAVGYTIDRPDNWYWQHFHKAALNETHPDVTDILALDRKPLPEIADIYDAKIVLEVANRNLESEISGLSVVQDSSSGTRYEGKRNGKDVIEYHTTLGNSVARFIYSAEQKNDTEVAVFDHMIESLVK